MEKWRKRESGREAREARARGTARAGARPRAGGDEKKRRGGAGPHLDCLQVGVAVCNIRLHTLQHVHGGLVHLWHGGKGVRYREVEGRYGCRYTRCC